MNIIGYQHMLGLGIKGHIALLVIWGLLIILLAAWLASQWIKRKEVKNMINTNHLLKVASAWISIVYVICSAGVAMMPGIRPGFMRYGLHMGIDMGQNILTGGTFISGLVIWNVIVLAAIWLFAGLFNGIKK